MLLAAWLLADTTLAGCKAGEEGRLRHRGGGRLELRAGEAKSSGKHESFCKVHLYNLTSIIMDQVRRFMKFTIALVANYAAAM